MLLWAIDIIGILSSVAAIVVTIKTHGMINDMERAQRKRRERAMLDEVQRSARLFAMRKG